MDTLSLMSKTFLDEFLLFIIVLLLTRWRVRIKNELKDDYDHTEWKPFIIGAALLFTLFISSEITVIELFNSGIENMWSKGSHFIVWTGCYLYASRDMAGFLATIIAVVERNNTVEAGVTEIKKALESSSNKDESNKGR